MKAKYEILDAALYKFDETGFMTGIIFPGMGLLPQMVVRGLNQLSLAIGNGQLMQGVNAAGWPIPVTSGIQR